MVDTKAYTSEEMIGKYILIEFALICYRIQFPGKKHENEVLLKTGFAATLCLQKKIN